MAQQASNTQISMPPRCEIQTCQSRLSIEFQSFPSSYSEPPYPPYYMPQTWPSRNLYGKRPHQGGGLWILANLINDADYYGSPIQIASPQSTQIQLGSNSTAAENARILWLFRPRISLHLHATPGHSPAMQTAILTPYFAIQLVCRNSQRSISWLWRSRSDGGLAEGSSSHTWCFAHAVSVAACIHTKIHAKKLFETALSTASSSRTLMATRFACADHRCYLILCQNRGHKPSRHEQNE